MINKKKNLKFILIIIVAILTFSLMIFNDAYSYFTSTVQFYNVTDNDGNKHRAKIGMQLSLLFDKLTVSSSDNISLDIEFNIPLTSEGTTYKSGLNGENKLDAGTYTDSDGNSVSVSSDGIYTATNSSKTIYVAKYDSSTKKVYYVFNSSCNWGTPSNPYIISDKKHLQNLSVLQNIGYFENLIISKKWTKSNDNNDIYYTASGTNYSEVSSMPYFLICEPDGTPVTIDCSEITFTPIGNDTYPFIGYVGGSFVDSTTSINGDESDQSIIYNITVETLEDQVDLGLFGSIGYLGNDSTAVSNAFTGIASTVQNLLLYDVKVVVNESKWTTQNSWIKNVYNHIFSFSSETEANQTKIYHENHHIGILAGHVEYASINYISVFYSTDDIAAIDLRHTSTATDGTTKANYLSISGILGYVYNMNCTNGNNQISLDGTQNDDISVSGGGVGTGGGAETGTGRGYVTAKDIYNTYDDSGNIVTYTNNGYTEEGLLVIASGTFGGTNTYSLQDGTTITISNNKAVVTSTYDGFVFEQTNEDEFDNFFVRYGSTGSYEYYHYNTTKVDSSKISISGTYLRFSAKLEDTTYTKLCIQYVRNRILFGTQNTNRYYFYDGVFTFALSDATDQISSTWKNSDGSADTITLGSTNPSDWEADVGEGNHSVVAYIKQVTSQTELQNAIDANKKVFIMYKIDDNSTFLVTLSENSYYNEGSGDDALQTYGTVLTYLDDDSETSLKNAISSGSVDISTIDGAIGSMDKDTLINNWDNYEILNLGEGSASISLDELKTLYAINTTYELNESSATYYDSDSNSIDTSSWTWSSGSQISETMTKTWDGYWYWYRDDSWYSGSHWYWNVFKFVSSSTGEVVYSYGSRTETGAKWDVGISASDYFGSSTTHYGATTYTVNGYEGRVFYKNQTFDNYYNEGMSRTTGSSYAGYGSKSGMWTSTYTNTYDYFIGTVAESGTTYKYLGSTNVTSLTQVYNGTGSTATPKTMTVYGNTYKVFTDGTHQGILLLTYDIGAYYTFSSTQTDESGASTTYTLRILQRNYYINQRYSLMCSDNTYATTGSNFTSTITPSVSNNTDAALNFSNGSVLISFTINGNTRYLQYVSGTTPYFHGVESNSESNLNLYIYTIEGTQDVSYGHITYSPKSNAITLSCDEYVLYPDSLSNVSGGATSTDDPTYTIKQIEQGGTQSITAGSTNVLLFNKGWKAGNGKYLTDEYLKMQFVLQNGISNISLASLFNGDTGIGSSEYVRAPIGSDGKESYIPLGCLAFRVNSSGTEQKVRVIVSVPQTDCYYGETDGDGNSANPLDYENDYYFCIWQVEQAGEQTITTISLSNALQAFELPRSNRYKPGNTASSNQSNYITVNYNGTQYRSYLNGERVLVAYEFTVSDEGVYVLGSNKGCQIVYFSADSTASEGRDGESSYKMGYIDYVYENNNTIVTVLNSDPTTDGNENYSYYYPSLSLFYTNNSSEVASGDNDTHSVTDGTNTYTYANINDFTFYVRRLLYTDNSTTTTRINWRIASGSSSNGNYFDAYYLKFTRYSVNADELNQGANTTR